MAVITAAAGGGNWTTGATWVGGVAPTVADDAVLDGTSGNVTIVSGAVCRSLDCNGYTGTLTHNTGVDLNIGDATAGTGNRALRLAAGMTYTLGSGTSSRIQFVTTNATPQSVTTAGKTLGNFVCNVNFVSTLALADALTSSGTITHTTGGFDTASFAVTASSFSSSNANTRTLTLGSSAITLSSTGTAWSAATVTNLTVTANTATVTLTGAAATFNTGVIDWNGLSVVLSGSGAQSFTVSGASGATVANLTRTGTAVTTDTFQIASVGTVTVTGTFTVTGNSAVNRVLVFSSALGTARTITAAVTSLTNVDFRDITAAGAAAWTGTSVANALGNTGITFTAPVTRYAVATGNVSATAVWSATSGGAPGASVPTCQDTMVLDAASGVITVTNDMPRMCADLTCTGFTGTLAVTTGPDIQGSVTLGSGMTVSGTGGVIFRGRGSHTITSAGRTWTMSHHWDCVTGTYTLADAYTNNRSASFAHRMTSGTFADGGFSINLTGALATTLWSSGAVTSSGTWTMVSAGAAIWDCRAGCTVNHTGTIILSGATATDRTFAGGASKTYGTLQDLNTLAGRLTISATTAIGFTNIRKTATVACTLTLPAGITTTITGDFDVQGQAGALLTVNAA